MKKIISIILLSTISIGSFSEGVFNMQIPQPDYISNDWDGDGFATLTESLLDEIIDVCNEVKGDLKSKNSYKLQSIGLVKKINSIINSNMDWSVKYDLFFSDNLSEKLNEMIGLDWICSKENDKNDLESYYEVITNKVGV